MYIDIEKFREFIRIEPKESKSKEVITEFDASGNEISKTVKEQFGDIEEQIDSVKYELCSKLIEMIIDPYPMDGEDESDSWKRSAENELDPYEIAKATLEKYGILKDIK